jgi:hypothetical protein
MAGLFHADLANLNQAVRHGRAVEAKRFHAPSPATLGQRARRELHSKFGQTLRTRAACVRLRAAEHEGHKNVTRLANVSFAYWQMPCASQVLHAQALRGSRG